MVICVFHLSTYELLNRLSERQQSNDKCSVQVDLSEMLLLIAVVLNLHFVLPSSCESITVETPVGTLIGQVDHHFQVSTFFGVPYAEKPVNNLRFHLPKWPVTWSGYLNASEHGAACIQDSISLSSVPHQGESEDCLFLDIYVDGVTINVQKKLPVLIYIHGGAFTVGSTSKTNLKPFVQGRGIIAVAIQYRLGLFGFAQSPDDMVIAGNAGLHDQLAAINWVKRYIDSFGGDDKSITVAGQSAGAISITYHTVSPLARNLFSQAIIQSGAHSTLPVATRKQSEERMKALIKATRCDKQSLDPYECLRYFPLDKLKLAISKLRSKSMTFQPSIDHLFFVDTDPVKLVKQGNFTTDLKSILMGHNGNEGGVMLSLFVAKVFPPYSDPPFKNIHKWPLKAATPFLPKRVRKIYSRLIDLTYGNRSMMPTTEIANKMGQVLGDATFACPSYNFASSYLQFNRKSRIYYYHFLYRPEKREAKGLCPYIQFAVHGGEIPFVFGKALLNPTNYTADELTFSKDLIDSWTTFVKNGNVTFDQWKPSQWIDGVEQVEMNHIVFANSTGPEFRSGFIDSSCERFIDANGESIIV